MKKPYKGTLHQIIETDSFLQYEKDCRKCSEGWQEVLPASISPEVRYASDKSLYVEVFFQSKHNHGVAFNEKHLIELLIKNYKRAKHPVFALYRDYLKKKSKSLARLDSKDKIEFNDVNQVIDENELNKILESLEKISGSHNYLTRRNNQICLKGKNQAYAFIHRLGTIGRFKVNFEENKSEIAKLFLSYYNIPIGNSPDPFQNMRKIQEVSVKTRNFFEDNID